jgi:hypothetical protein
MKTLIAGIILIVLLGLGGFLYRAATENANQTIACPVDAKLCPDGTSVSHTGPSCSFPACPAPNISFDSLNLAFALPDGYTANELPDAAAIAAYGKNINATSTIESDIVIHDYQVTASTTALQVIQNTAVGDASGAPVPVTAYSSQQIGTHRYTIVSLGRFEGVVHTAFYLTRGNDVLRFDAINKNVLNWTDPSLDASALPANVDVKQLLTTLQGDQGE